VLPFDCFGYSDSTYNRECAFQDAECQVSTETANRRYGILFWLPESTLTMSLHDQTNKSR